MRLRYFFKFDHKKEPIPGSNVRSKSKPGNQWAEITPICCEPDSIECTCGWRYFVQLDSKKNPVDGTLIKRKAWPKMDDGIHYQEVQAPDCCALISWEIAAGDFGQGNLKIYDNGLLIIDKDVIPNDDFTGSFRPSKSNSSIQVILTNSSDGTQVNVLNITGGHTHSDTTTPEIDYTFDFSNKNLTIYGSVEGSDPEA
jgi:hypothetical protein